MTELKATPLTGSLSGYYKAQYKNYAAIGLTASEAERMLSEMMKRRGL